jgi:hypothetical protein
MSCGQWRAMAGGVDSIANSIDYGAEAGRKYGTAGGWRACGVSK